MEYVRDAVHTNGIENFWSLLKRTIKGTYVSVEPFHLGRYLDEQSFRFNERDDNDAGRFKSVLSSVFEKRLNPVVVVEATRQGQAPKGLFRRQKMKRQWSDLRRSHGRF